MDGHNHRPALIVGELAEFLGVSTGTINDIPMGVLTFRLHTKSSQPLNLMISPAQLARLREDIDFVLERSATLKYTDSTWVSLAEMATIHERLG